MSCVLSIVIANNCCPSPKYSSSRSIACFLWTIKPFNFLTRRLSGYQLVSAYQSALFWPPILWLRISPGWLFGYAGGIPLLFFILWAAVQRPGVHKIHVTILGLFISLILTSFLTDVVKNSVGRPRPDLLARCKPKEGTAEHSLVTFDVCTETDHHILHDGWRSFPSGHSSFAFSGLGYLAL